MTQDIEAAGFQDVVETIYNVPLGGWAADTKLRDLGHWCLLAIDLGLEGYAMAMLTRVLEVCFSEFICGLKRGDD